MNYQGKVALITGANSGIGEAIAHELASQGSTIVVNGRRAQENERVASDLRDRHGVEVHVATCDVSQEDTCLRLVKETIERNGRLDVLVNNAGVGASGRIADSDSGTFDRLMKTNLYSCYWLSREAFKAMETQSVVDDTQLRGAIINISSLVGVDAWAGSGIYATTKHGMIALTKAMAEEGGEVGIRVSAVCPALVATAMTGASGSEVIQPEDIANTVAYLLNLSAAAWPTEVVVKRRGAD